MSSFFIAFDLGSSSLKAALLDESAGILATAHKSLETSFPRRGWAEQDTDDWWAALRHCTRDLIAKSGLSASDIACLSFSSQTCNAIPVGADGRALGKAILWLDTRSALIAQRLVGGWPNIGGYGLIPAIRWLTLTNGAPNPSGKDPITKYLWLREERPDIWSKTATLCDAKDYLIGRLTGTPATTPDCANLTWLMNPKTNNWSDRILKHVDLDRSLLPPIRNAVEMVGDGLSAEAADHLELHSGTPVVGGTSDLVAFSLAAGDMRNGTAHIYIGSSAWCAAHIPKSKADPRTSIGSIRAADPGRFLLVAAQESAGTALSKIGDAVLPSSSMADGSFTALADGSPVGSNGVLVLPWMHGERTPVSSSALRGTVLNLGLDTAPADVARAALESVAMNIYWAGRHVCRMARTAEDRPIRLLGAAAENDIIAQSISTLFNRPVARMAHPHLGGVFGAWACAAVGIGAFSTLEDATTSFRVDRTFVPQQSDGKTLHRQFRRFENAYKSLRPWYDAVSSDQEQSS